jgi:hypothetical protein
LMKMPIFIGIAFIPLEALTVRNDGFHYRCILQQYTSFVKSCKVTLSFGCFFSSPNYYLSRKNLYTSTSIYLE